MKNIICTMGDVRGDFLRPPYGTILRLKENKNVTAASWNRQYLSLGGLVVVQKSPYISNQTAWMFCSRRQELKKPVFS